MLRNVLSLLLFAGATTAPAMAQEVPVAPEPSDNVAEPTQVVALAPTEALLFQSGVAIEIPNATLQEAVRRPGDQFILTTVRVSSSDGVTCYDLFLEVPEVQFREQLTAATTLQSQMPFDGLMLDRNVFGHSSDSEALVIEAHTEIRDTPSRPSDSSCPPTVDCIWKSPKLTCVEIAVVDPCPPEPVHSGFTVASSDGWAPMPFLQRVNYTPPKEIEHCCPMPALVFADYGRRAIGVSAGFVFGTSSYQPPVDPPVDPPCPPAH